MARETDAQRYDRIRSGLNQGQYAALRRQVATRRSGDANYFFPSRYGGDLSLPELANAKRNLDNVAAQDDRFNAIARQRDTGVFGDTPEIHAAATAYGRQFRQAQVAQPMEAGTLGGRRVQVVGPNMIRVFSNDGIGSTTFSTAARGKPIDAHLYLQSHPDFVASPDYAKQKQAAVERNLGIAPAENPTVDMRSGTLNRGGVATPLENVSQADRMQYDAYPPGAQGFGARAWDTLTASPAAKAVGRFAGNAIDAVTGWLGNRGQLEPTEPVPQSNPRLGDNAAGGSIPAGVSNKQAARIQTPTAASPIPKTETSPAPDVNSTQLSTAPTPGTATPAPQAGGVPPQPQAAVTPAPTPPPAPTPVPDERRYAYEGF